MRWSQEVAERTRAAFEPLADPARAEQMTAYMKRIAPFLGIAAGPRRAAQRSAWAGLADPPRPELIAAAGILGGLPQREYHYAAVELLGRHRIRLSPEDLDGPVRLQMLRHPW